MPRTRSSVARGSYFLNRLRKHFGVDPGNLSLVSQSIAPYDRPNLHLAIEKLLSRKGVTFDLEGAESPRSKPAACLRGRWPR